ncbi:MAG: hypothetical protein ABJF11_08220 [Reichenbachiella sp.]|uniref:hypothetical protein n=1 Tax=Reichenbachiella sp. TaxID=2184521 RepID=UPI003263AAE4
MKNSTPVLFVILLLLACNTKTNHNMTQFISEKEVRSASFILDAEIERVFPLFGAFEERKWEKHWKPKLIYPETEVIEEGTTFSSDGSAEEGEYLWRVSKFDPGLFHIQYLVSTQNRYWTITVKCQSSADQKTKAEVTYSFIGLNEKGNQLNKIAADKMYSRNLEDWVEAINYYLEHGKAI